jgi:hypothetical protein
MLFVDDLLMLPFTGFKSILRTLIKVAEEQYTDDAPLKERLLNLQMELENGDVSEEEYVELEAEILRELRQVQHRRMEMAGVDPNDYAGGLSGKVKEGSGASLTFTPNEPVAEVVAEPIAEKQEPAAPKRRRKK